MNSRGDLIRKPDRTGKGQTILLERERIKRGTIQHRRLMRHQKAA